MVEMTKKVWIGTDPSKMSCDGCHLLFHNAFSDIATFNGQWGNFCDDCLPSFAVHNPCKYGTGLGQRYEKQGKHWVKVAG